MFTIYIYVHVRILIQLSPFIIYYTDTYKNTRVNYNIIEMFASWLVVFSMHNNLYNI